MTWKLCLNIIATVLASLAAAGVTCHFWPPSFELFASDNNSCHLFRYDIAAHIILDARPSPSCHCLCHISGYWNRTYSARPFLPL